MSDQTALSEAQHKQCALELNKLTWKWLDLHDRTEDQDRLMIHAAHGSCFHWSRAGGGVQQQRGEWLVARVYAVLEHPEAALYHARRCMEFTEAHKAELKDFDLAYAQEGLARALAAAGLKDEARSHFVQAQILGDKIADPEDRKIFQNDFAADPWYGLR
ncbi:MAG: hypothetical protein AMXMBFR7_30760 [Planctomycetota bacterium]